MQRIDLLDCSMFGPGGVALGRFEFQKVLRAGTFGTVILYKHPATQELVAVKEVRIPDNDEGAYYSTVQRELAVLRRLAGNENIVKILEYHEIIAEDKVRIVMEYCNGGDYDRYLNLHTTVPEITLQYFVRQLALGLQCLNDKGILHRDLKPANILLHTRNGEALTRGTDHRNIVLKLGDFGLSKKMMTDRWTNTTCGTLMYIAPEVLDNRKIRDVTTLPHKGKADLWSLGVVLLVSLLGKTEPVHTTPSIILQVADHEKMHGQIQSRAASLSPSQGSVNLKSLLCGLLQPDFTQRIGFSQFRQHPFLTLREESTIVSLNAIREAFVNNGYSAPSDYHCMMIQQQATDLGGISTKRELAMFLAHVMQESGGLMFRDEQREQSHGADPFTGRGYLQIRSERIYREATVALLANGSLKEPASLVTDPHLVSSSEELSWKTAFWYWKMYVHDRMTENPSFLQTVDLLYPGIPRFVPGSSWKCVDPDNRTEKYQITCAAFGFDPT
ncbi:hypothetical protein RvY_11946 [Ramazzottius varieornatus]|uniref:Protein kinase domain-containing protein n=1 Tax=Ramazzottius varieornatus TaxID=947166 RepID=A0A1D1VRM5_RAMVA|nr:hypothetical protein RvY_11946 [Ramazzottius varieornatus]